MGTSVPTDKLKSRWRAWIQLQGWPKSMHGTKYYIPGTWYQIFGSCILTYRYEAPVPGVYFSHKQQAPHLVMARTSTRERCVLRPCVVFCSEIPGIHWYRIPTTIVRKRALRNARRDIQKNRKNWKTHHFTPLTDDRYDLSPLHDIDISEDIYIPGTHTHTYIVMIRRI